MRNVIVFKALTVYTRGKDDTRWEETGGYPADLSLSEQYQTAGRIIAMQVLRSKYMGILEEKEKRITP